MAIEGRSPFIATFGSQPPTLAGRDELVDSVVEDMLEGGPPAKGFTRAFTGDRGIGKTVLLDVVARKLHTKGDWVAVHYQATTREDPLLGLSREAAKALPHLGQKWETVERSLNAGVNLGPISLGGQVRQERALAQVPPRAVLAGTLEALGTAARTQRKGVIVTIDEAHVLKDDLWYQEIGSVWQMLVKRQLLPVSLLMAGLPTLKDRIRHADGTFFDRLMWDPIGPIGIDSSRLAILEPIATGGNIIELAALDLLARESGGHPYFLQLLGDESWKAAVGSDAITMGHAQVGFHEAVELYREIMADRWTLLSPMEQQYLKAASSLGPGPVKTAEVARKLGKQSTTETSYLRDSLIREHQLLLDAGDGTVDFKLRKFGEWVRGAHQVLPESPTLRASRSRRDRPTRPGE
jgi:hypothetical protein